MLTDDNARQGQRTRWGLRGATGRHASGTPAQHLMVSLLLGEASTAVSSVALAPGRPPQLLSNVHTWLAVVTRGADVVHLCRIPDPFRDRGLRSGHGSAHTAGTGAQGRACVAVPFGSIADLTSSRVHLLDHAGDIGEHDRVGLRAEVARVIEAGAGVRTLGFDSITAAPQWSVVGEMLGWSGPTS